MKGSGLAKKSLLSLPRCREMFATFLFLTVLTHSSFDGRSPLRAGLVPVVNRIYRYASFADMSSSREGMKARSGIHARLRARHRKHEAVDEKRHQSMKLNIQTASDHAVLELSFHSHFPRARRLKSRQRLEFSTRFPSHTHDDTHTTHT